MKKNLILLVASLTLLLMSTAALALAQGSGDLDEVRCFIPEGCDIDSDGVPDLRAGEPVPGGELGPGAVQYNNAL